MMSLDTFVTLVETEILRNQLVFRDTDELVIPFSLLYHNVSMIDSLGFDSLSFNQDSLSYFPLGNENDIYSKVLLKSCAPLEFEVDLGYREGYLKYVPELISLSPDISNLVLKLMLDKGMNRLIQPII